MKRDFWLDPDPSSMNLDPKHGIQQTLTFKRNKDVCALKIL